MARARSGPHRYRAGRLMIKAFDGTTPIDRVWGGLEQADSCFSGLHCWDKPPNGPALVFGCHSLDCPSKAAVLFDQGRAVAFASATVTLSDIDRDRNALGKARLRDLDLNANLAMFVEGLERRDIKPTMSCMSKIRSGMNWAFPLDRLTSP